MRRFIAILALCVTIISCGSGSTDTPGGSGGTAVGPSGGTVTSTDGNARLTIPAGALASSVAITAQPMTNPPTASGLVRTSAFEFGPTGTQFSVPATLRITYQPSALPSGVSPVFLHLVLLNGTTWDSVPGSVVDTAAHTVTGAISHFSSYALCASACEIPGLGYGIVRTSFPGACCTVLPQGQTTTIKGVLEANDYTGTASMTMDSLPTGVTGSLSLGAIVGECTDICYRAIVIQLTVATTAPVGIFTIPLTVTAPTANAISSSPLPVQINQLAGYTLAAGSPTVSLPLGGSSGTTVSITRSAFPDPVTLSATGLPAGVTAVFNPVQLTGTTLTSTVTFTAGSGAAAGTSNVVLKGTASGQPDQNAKLAVTVASFAIAAVPPTATITAGASTSAGIRVTRSAGFNGTVTYAVTGAVSGLTAVLSSTAVADSSQLTITTTSALAPGVYPITVTATSGATSLSATVTVTVGSAGAGLRFDWSQCAIQPLWFAYQYGSGAWTVLPGSGQVYTLPANASSTAAIAFVFQVTAGVFHTQVDFFTSAELAAGASGGVRCPQSPGSGLAGTVSGIHTSDTAVVSLGMAAAAPTADGPFQITNVQPGASTVLAHLASAFGDKLIIERGATTPGTINFASGTTPVSATATVTGGSGSAPTIQMSYVTATSAACQGSLLYARSPAGATFAFTGVPGSLQQGSDLHALLAVDAGSIGTRTVIDFFHAMANQTLALGSPITATVDVVGGSYKRLRASLTLPSDYGFVSMTVGTNSLIQALDESTGYAGGGAMAVTMPDFSGLSGFLTAWEPPAGTPQSYLVSGVSGSVIGQPCTDGSSTRTAYVFGNM